MSPFIFGKRNTIHIIDIRETVKGLLRAKKFLTRTVAGGKDVLFVGTKRQAKHHIMAQAGRVSMPWVAERWLGGTLTNFRTIRSRLARLEELEAAESDGTALEYSKKMMSMRSRELRKIKRNLDGIRKMDKLPGALVVVDVHREKNAVREARNLHIPTVCLIDTDSDPTFADIPIPGNDDAMRSIEMVLMHLADAVEEGMHARRELPKEPEPSDDGNGRPPRGERRDRGERGGRGGRGDRRPRRPEAGSPEALAAQAAPAPQTPGTDGSETPVAGEPTSPPPGPDAQG
jgi:small subunit ribosomal protein S2